MASTKKSAKPFAGESLKEEQAEQKLIKKHGSIKKAMQAAKKPAKKGKK